MANNTTLGSTEMGIYKVKDMALVPQPGTGTCWCASAIMLYKWSRKAGYLTMVDPLSDSGTRWRWENNKSWSKYDNPWLAKTLNIYTYDEIPRSYDGLRTFLKDWGPIWASGLKTWTGSAYGHVVVIGGVADTGVLIYDPEPVGQGKSFWMTWNQLDTYIKGEPAEAQFMTVN